MSKADVAAIESTAKTFATEGPVSAQATSDKTVFPFHFLTGGCVRRMCF